MALPLLVITLLYFTSAPACTAIAAAGSLTFFILRSGGRLFTSLNFSHGYICLGLPYREDFVIYVFYLSASNFRVLNRMMPPKSKATTRSAKKGKSVCSKPAAIAPSDNEADWPSEEEELSMRDVVRNLTAMMASMNSRLNQMDGRGRKRRKESSAVPEAEGAVQTKAPSLPSRPSTVWQPPLDCTTGSALIPVKDYPFPAPEHQRQ